jgi:hypothetical protein
VVTPEKSADLRMCRVFSGVTFPDGLPLKCWGEQP